MQKKRYLIAILALLTPFEAIAADWSSIIKNKNYEVLVDIDSYNVSEGYPYIVTKTLFNALQHYQLKNKKIQYASSVSTTQFNCKTPLFNTKSHHFYDKKGQLLATDNSKNTFKPLIAGSDEMAVGQLTCQVHQMVGGQ